MRKRLYICLSALLAAMCLSAAPAHSRWQERVLSDGSTCLLRLVGDEDFHYWETPSGQIAEEQEDGTFVLVQQSSAQRLAARPASEPHKAIGTPTKAPRGLVILVEFEDTKFNSANTPAALYDMFNKEGYNYDGASGSAADYFNAQSNGQYRPVFDVIGPVVLDSAVAYYGGQSGTVSDMYIADFVIEAIKAADEAGCDFSQYDADKDGKVDIVYLFYAGKGQADGGATSTIWPHNWTIRDALWYGRTHGKTGYTILNLPKLDGYTVNNYACSGELNKSGRRAGIGTFCHEFSHVLGLPDYYVTESTAANSGKDYTPGDWTIMDQGLYNNEGKTPPNYSAFDKYFMGWLTPKALLKNQVAEVTLTTGYTDVYQISGATNGPKVYTYSQTMWYLENRQKKGWDTYLPGQGMCVWEVTYNSTNWKNNKPNNAVVGYTIVTASNLTKPYTPYNDLSGNLVSSGTPFPGKMSIRTFTPVEGCALTNISENAGQITFDYNGGFSEYTYELLGEKCTVPEDGVVEKQAPLELVITPDEGYTLADPSCWTVEMRGVELLYNSGFTYDEATSTFRIPKVTGVVVILVEAIVKTATGNAENLRLQTVPGTKRLCFENGNLYILSNEQKYTLTGQKINP